MRILSLCGVGEVRRCYFVEDAQTCASIVQNAHTIRIVGCLVCTILDTVMDYSVRGVCPVFTFIGSAVDPSFCGS